MIKMILIELILTWLLAWVELLESIITIITLGIIQPEWSYKIVETKWYYIVRI
jgi:hypothetical protein